MIEMLYFSAPWCGPCKMMTQPIEELKAAGWNITKINSDVDKALAAKYQIMAIPTFVILKDGQPVRRFTGARQKSAIEGELKLAQG